MNSKLDVASIDDSYVALKKGEFRFERVGEVFPQRTNFLGVSVIPDTLEELKSENDVDGPPKYTTFKLAMVQAYRAASR